MLLTDENIEKIEEKYGDIIDMRELYDTVWKVNKVCAEIRRMQWDLDDETDVFPDERFFPKSKTYLKHENIGSVDIKYHYYTIKKIRCGIKVTVDGTIVTPSIYTRLIRDTEEFKKHPYYWSRDNTEVEKEALKIVKETKEKWEQDYEKFKKLFDDIIKYKALMR